MKVQIYEHSTPEEAMASAASGADFVGFCVGERGRLPHEVDFATGRAIVAALPATAMSVALTVATGLDEIAETIDAVRPDVIHLSAGTDEIPAELVGELRRRLPPVRILVAVAVGGPETRDAALDVARRFDRVADYLILDTANGGLDAIGASGSLHDWAISAEIVRTVHVPVILAGGLSAENVADAIRAVDPWGVDSCTHTNVPGTRRKDAARVRAFVEAARSARSTSTPR